MSIHGFHLSRNAHTRDHPYPSRAAIALSALALMLVLWLWLAFEAVINSPGPNGAVFGVDFSHTYAAVRLVSTGHNPYTYQGLSAAQHALLDPQGLPVQPRSAVVLVGTSAFYLWALQPMNSIPFQASAVGWMLCTFALVGFVFLALLRHLGWTRRGIPAVLFLSTPAVVLATFYGNTISVVFAGMVGGYILRARRPFIAGVLLSLAVLKLPVALPLVGLIVLFDAPRKRSMIAGFLVAFLSRQVVTVAVLGLQYEKWWLQAMLTFSHSMSVQPNLSSLSGLYAQLLPRSATLVLEAATVCLAGAATLAFRWRLRHQPTVPMAQTGWLWFLWMVATPYSHFIDEMLLVIPVLVLLGPDGRHVTSRISVGVLYLLGLSIFLYSWTPLHMQLLWAPLAVCAGCLALVAFRPSLHPARLPDRKPLYVERRRLATDAAPVPG